MKIFSAVLGLSVIIASLATVTLAAYGWLMNILWVFHHFHDGVTGELIIRIVGIPIVIIGAILGYIS